MIKTSKQLIEEPIALRPHVVLLGAGSSKAAFPYGEAKGQQLPVMNDLVDILELHPLIEEAGIGREQQKNFESLYAQLVSDPRHANIAKKVERRIFEFFSGLLLPNQATLYDRLLVSLRPSDAVFTFNWDPFLFDAFMRNREAVPLPDIFFLHGNVRIGACPNHDRWGARNSQCPECHLLFTDVPLLYPIGQKDYSHPYTQRNRTMAESLFRDAFTLTIFGYGAPDSDKVAVALLNSAWTARSNRTLEHIELIDTACSTQLHERWKPFAPTNHYHVTKAFEQSRIALWPRRSCESLFHPMSHGVPCEKFPIPSTDSLADLQAYAAQIASYEDRV